MRPLVFVTALCMCAGVLVPEPPWVWGQGSSLQEKIEKEKRSLEQLKQEIQKAKKQRDRSRKEQNAVLQLIERLDRQIHKKQREVEEIDREIRQKEQDIQTRKEQIEKLQSQINERKAMVETYLRRLYVDGQTGRLDPLLTARSYAQFQNRWRYLSVRATIERQRVKAHQRDLAEIEHQREQQTNVLQALRAKKKRRDMTLNKKKGIRRKKRVVLASLKRSHQHTLSTLEHKEAVLKELEQQNRSAAGPSQGLKKGKLKRPASGEIVGHFGPQKHPTFDTFIDREGIEIATREGNKIYAVSDGKVVYADWLKGYGLVVILDHGNKYFTFYAHASELKAKKGTMVVQGEVLGETGSSGLTDKPVLYFELRRGRKPMNPTGWFEKG